MAAMPRSSDLPLPLVRVLATGGTIAGAPIPGSKRGYQAGVFSIDSLLEAVPQIKTLANLEVESVAKIGSQDMDEAVWRKLAQRTQAALDRPEIGGVVITHGTDTMEETGYFLNLVVKSAKPVVLVGAMRPATAISPDGPMNLYNAVAVAAHPDAGGRSVVVVANDEIHFAREVSKTNTTQVGTFRSTNRGLAGLVHSGRVHFYAKPVRRHTVDSTFTLSPDSFPQVDIIYAYAGMGAELIDAAVRAGARGLVLAGMGDGNLGAKALAAAAEAVRAGVTIVRSSRTGGGFVERNGEIDDDKHGFVVADELNPQKSRILLTLAIAQNRTAAQIQELFYTY